MFHYVNWRIAKKLKALRLKADRGSADSQIDIFVVSDNVVNLWGPGF